MISRFSSEDGQQLAPLLGSVARLVANGSQLREDELRVLLLGVDMDYNPLALNELKAWVRLLKGVRERPLPELRIATVEALMLRNLPEASVLLAVDTVTSGISQVSLASPSSQDQHLRTSLSNLDFGSLPSGQSATQEFDIFGGPGRIVVENDQLQVSPLQFGSGTTHVKVVIKPLNTDLLWTSLKLVTYSETIDIPVLAQWTTTSTNIVSQPLPVSAQDSDLVGMIEQAMGVSSDPTSIQESYGSTSKDPWQTPANTHTHQPKVSGEKDILEQLRNMFD